MSLERQRLSIARRDDMHTIDSLNGILASLVSLVGTAIVIITFIWRILRRYVGTIVDDGFKPIMDEVKGMREELDTHNQRLNEHVNHTGDAIDRLTTEVKRRNRW